MAGGREGRIGWAWALFAAATLAAVLTGCWVARASGVSPRLWTLNAAAWAAGAAVAGGLTLLRRGPGRGWLLVALGGLALTFAGAGLSGVHRWIGLGPVRINAAELLLAPAIVAFAATSSPTRIAFALAGVALLAVQPDASQAVAFAGALTAVLWTTPADPRRSLAVSLALAAGALVAALRPDPLAPVPEVEGVLRLATALSPGVAGLAVLALAGTVAVPLAVAPAPSTPLRRGAVGLAAYLGLAALAPLAGAFPVPLVGMGVGPILGAWLGFGVLAGLARDRKASAERRRRA